jgi:hypothetical protein
MKRARMARLGIALALRYRRLWTPLARKAARHPRRTWRAARYGKAAAAVVQQTRSSPRAQAELAGGVAALTRAAKRTRAKGPKAAASDEAILRELLQATAQLTAAVEAMRPGPPKRRRLRRAGARLLVAGGAGYLGYRSLKQRRERSAA